MIPYFQFPSLELGPFTLQSFGVLAAAGVALAAWLLVREARRAGLDPTPLFEVPTWAIAGGVLGAHLMHVFLYHPEELHGPHGAWQIFKLWDGLSSTGGVLGGSLAVVLWFRAHGRAFSEYADVFALAVPSAWPAPSPPLFSLPDHPAPLPPFP